MTFFFIVGLMVAPWKDIDLFYQDKRRLQCGGWPCTRCLWVNEASASKCWRCNQPSWELQLRFRSCSGICCSIFLYNFHVRQFQGDAWSHFCMHNMVCTWNLFCTGVQYIENIIPNFATGWHCVTVHRPMDDVWWNSSWRMLRWSWASNRGTNGMGMLSVNPMISTSQTLRFRLVNKFGGPCLILVCHFSGHGGRQIYCISLLAWIEAKPIFVCESVGWLHMYIVPLVRTSLNWPSH